MQFGCKMNVGNLGQEETTRMVKLALDRGINFIDTADVYSLGDPGPKVLHPEKYGEDGSWKDLRGSRWSG
jgi:aryl-alcohol dehydrogenase-like predicted oxidoreductase